MANHHSNKRILLMGDYNLKEINWVEHYTAGSKTSLPHLFYENIKDCFLYQHVDKPTRFKGEQQESVLDLVFTKEEHDIKNIEIYQPLGNSDHGLVIFYFICKWRTSINFQPHRLYFKGNYEALNDLIRGTNWGEELEDKNVDEKWVYF